MTLPLELIIAGSVIGFIGLAFGVINMVFMSTKVTLKAMSSKPDNWFMRHGIAMIIMAFGGLLLMIGLFLAGYDFLSRLF